MAVANATITQLYAGKAKAQAAVLALESITLTGNPSAALRIEVDAKIAAAIVALQAVAAA